jgi:hypothetical protein
MTNLNIIPNFDKKTAKFEGAIAAGENIHVNISNIGGYIVGTENLRLRAVGSKGEALAQFPLLGDEGLNWVKDGDTIECDLNLNTVQMLDAVPPAARVMILFVLDNPKDEILYFKSFVSVDHWPRRVGEDEPVDLGGYTDFVQETLRSIESIEDRVDEAEKIAKDAQESASGSAESAAAYAEEAKGYAQKANDVLKGAATKEEVNSVKDSLTDKADADKVWLRGGDVTGETNHAKSIKVNEIEALDDESDIKFNSPITTSEIEDEYGHIQNITIKNNEISARFMEDEWGGGSYGTIVMNAALELPNGGIYCPSHPITASSIDTYACYLTEDGWVSFKGYDDNGDYGEHSLDYRELMFLLDNSWYVQGNLRGHITHDIVDDDWHGYGAGVVTITSTDDYGGSSDFRFYSDGTLSLNGSLSAFDVSCGGYVSCDHVLTTSGVYANSYIEESEEWGDSDFGGYSVTDSNNSDITSRLLAGKLRIEQYYYDGGHDGYYDYVEIRVRNGLSLSLSYGGEKLKFTFSDFATLRTMIDEYNASKGA